MTHSRTWIVTCLVLAAVSVVAFSPTDAPAAVAAGAEKSGIDLSSVGAAADIAPPGSCGDIAYSDVFRSEGLGYVSTEEFAAALRAVAGGESRYSPTEIPRDWESSAANWGVTGGQGGEVCSPSLVYLASMEYRLRAGKPKLKPAFPVLVRDATRDLAERADAKRLLAARYAARTNAIASKLRDAERMGAGECAPGTLASAKATLERARREAAGVRTSVQETASSFLEAERFADALLSGQRLAMSKGLRCYRE